VEHAWFYRVSLPTWSEFELGRAPVFWKTSNGLPPSPVRSRNPAILSLICFPSNKLINPKRPAENSVRPYVCHRSGRGADAILQPGGVKAVPQRRVRRGVQRRLQPAHHVRRRAEADDAAGQGQGRPSHLHHQDTRAAARLVLMVQFHNSVREQTEHVRDLNYTCSCYRRCSH
jgi:hypothetical protein